MLLTCLLPHCMQRGKVGSFAVHYQMYLCCRIQHMGMLQGHPSISERYLIITIFCLVGSTSNMPHVQCSLSPCQCKTVSVESGTFPAGAQKQQSKAGQGSAEACQAALGLWSQVPGQLRAERARDWGRLPLLGV